ncbi:hypothetical protein IV203_027687 [Nitzschia inconspicua]|uniref:Uncharacterized protein n=1 Tax=Nitzschia inconspicua TaxID=303405 RepID=A0A9K3Q421_9STRA|nr:hypothetical protein IV203_027687 [Nitzschia inconspicua]
MRPEDMPECDTPEYERYEDGETAAFNVDDRDDIDQDAIGIYLKAEVTLPIAGEMLTGNVSWRKRDADGNLIGKSASNPIMDTRMYVVSFPDGREEEYSANIIAENMLSMCDPEGNQFILMKHITDHKKEGMAIPKEDAYVWIKERKYPRKTTKGWKLCVEWKDGTTSWESLSALKESNPVEVAEYAVAHNLTEEPAFNWWVPYTLKKRDAIVSAVNNRYWKRTHKYGIRIPKTVKEAFEIRCFYKLRWTANTHGGTRLRDAHSFATALLDAHSAGKTDIDVLVGTNHLHFDPQHAPISYLNWEAISNTPFPSPTASDIASAFTRSLPSVDDLGLAIANAFAAVQGNTSTTGAPYSTSASPSLSGLSSSIFNPGNLPTDVLDCYQRHRNNKVFTPALLTQFDGGVFYHEDGVDRLILRDGTFFVMSREDERNFLREFVPCVDDSPIGLRLWYHQVVRHAHSHGYYVHPFWCFWKHPRGGDHGFTCGSLADDDLPQRMSLPTLRHSPTIYTFLTKCVFPPTSNIPSRISLSHGDGYTALRNIIFDVHPVFHPTPAILAKNYPTHQEGSTHAYFRAFEDYLQLRAFTQHIDSSLDKPHELDIFISNHRYSTFLGAEYAVACRDPGALLKFQHHQLVQTIDTLLKLPHSPASTPSAQPSSKLTNPPPR